MWGGYQRFSDKQKIAEAFALGLSINSRTIFDEGQSA
jgi:hypothetical protein